MPELIDLDEMLNNSIAGAKEEADRKIREEREKFETGQVLISGPGCIAYVRTIRNDVLNLYRLVKNKIFQETRSRLTREGQTHGLQALREISQKIGQQESRTEAAKQYQERLQTDIEKLSAYKKFQLYGNESRLQDIEKKGSSASPTSKAVLREHKDYNTRRYASVVQGVGFSLLCALMDYSIINSVFLASNVSGEMAFFMAMISAIALDVPPYLLGSVWQKRNDQQRFWILCEREEDKVAQIDLRSYAIRIFMLCAVIILFFSTYLAFRVLLFLGGGNFNLAMHFLLNLEFHFEGVQFSSADWISTLVPLVTSAAAFVLGASKYESFTAHIETMGVLIDSDMKSQAQILQAMIIRYDAEEADLREQYDTKKYEVWTCYFAQNPMPVQDSEFKQQVCAEFQRRNLKTYLTTYRNCCIQLRTTAEATLENVKLELVPYVANPVDITEMGLNDIERDTLDNFWVMEEGGIQHKDTLENMQEIQDLVEELIRGFDNPQQERSNPNE